MEILRSMNRLRFSIELTAFAARSTLDVSAGPVAADDVLSREVRLIERLWVGQLEGRWSAA
jgi:chemotaxis regulatin CheY-phosphate phosphatase CheZ